MTNNIPFEFIPQNVTFEQMNAIITFRNIWLELSMWMRSFVHSFIDDHPRLAAVSDRLYVGVPLKFYNALIVFYGNQIAEEYLNRISRLILIFWRLVDARKRGDQEAVNRITVELYETADQGADFLASINDYWDASVWRDLFTQLINMGIQVILSILQGNYQNEIRVFDRIQDLAVVMADYMARGILLGGLNHPASMMSPVEASTATIQ
ncbi:MAG TPA: hypothetical protein PLD22_00130 [Bacillota bacterium]|jgi:hypothetical protein|nr:hypothetical protein [Clostridiales bacterium UBA9856]HOA42114.1 hypothetical protein [Bacillota bacterium]HPZ59373.1 hypothetical protein [Bacillota bacterium]HQC81719.1 hypothetical protein [Bacillota bacterium]